MNIFFTGELFNVEKETYNYNVINERLSMTSFKSAEEFIREYEKMYYSFQDFFISYPNLTKSELLLDNFNNEAILNNIDSFDARGISCWQQCFQDYNICQKCYKEKLYNCCWSLWFCWSYYSYWPTWNWNVFCWGLALF